MIAFKPVNERRGEPRLDNNIPVKFCQEGGDFVAETQNISRSGTYCHVDKNIEPMTKLKIHLLLTSPGEGKKGAHKVSCEGVVVRCEPVVDGEGYQLAVFFSDITKRDAEYITDYVSAHLQQDGSI
jgi:hypothetical protein